MSSEGDPREQAPSTPETPSNPQDGSQALSSAARVWAQYKDLIFERMTAIETAVTALRRAQLTDEIRQKAVLEAHRLAGSLGMFGLPEGTRLAREIEHIFAEPASFGHETPRKLTEAAAALRRILEKGVA